VEAAVCVRLIQERPGVAAGALVNHTIPSVSVDPGVTNVRNFSVVAPSRITAPSASRVGPFGQRSGPGIEQELEQPEQLRPACTMEPWQISSRRPRSNTQSPNTRRMGDNSDYAVRLSSSIGRLPQILNLVDDVMKARLQGVHQATSGT
jgi:hypothetical protein